MSRFPWFVRFRDSGFKILDGLKVERQRKQMQDTNGISDKVESDSFIMTGSSY